MYILIFYRNTSKESLDNVTIRDKRASRFTSPVYNRSLVESAQAIVYIDTLRNINSSVFVSNYSQTVTEYADIGHKVVAVRASDGDLPNSPSGQLTHELADGLTAGDVDYFDIGLLADPGVTTVNRSLKNFPGNDMYFIVIASDRAVPPKSAVVYVCVR